MACEQVTQMTTDELARLRKRAEGKLAGFCPECGGVPGDALPAIRAYIAALEARVAALDGWKQVTETEPAPGPGRIETLWSNNTIRIGEDEWDTMPCSSRPAFFRSWLPTVKP